MNQGVVPPVGTDLVERHRAYHHNNHRQQRAEYLIVPQSAFDRWADNGELRLAVELHYHRIIRKQVRAALPPDETVLAVSRGDEELFQQDGHGVGTSGRRRDRMPGTTPADGGRAVLHSEICGLQELKTCSCQAQRPGGWSTTSEFAEYLAYQNDVTMDKDVCVMYQLTDRGCPPLPADCHTGLTL